MRWPASLGRPDHARGALVIVDQGISSLSNGLFAFAVAGTLSAEAYGSFALSYAILGGGLMMWRRGVLLELSLRRGSEVAASEVEAQILRLLLRLTPLLVLAPLATLAVARVGITIESIALALIGPVILVHDTLRVACLARDRTTRALVSDALWLVLTAGAFALAIGGRASYGTITATWCVAAAAALVILVPPRPRDLGNGWRRVQAADPFFATPRRRRRLHNGTAGALGPLTFIAFMAIIGRLAGGTVVATLSGTALLMFPITILATSIPLLLTSGGRPGGPGSRRISGLVAVCLLVTATWLVVVLALPEAVGTALLGDTWAFVQPLLALGTVAAGAQAIEVAVTSALQLRGRSGVPLTISAFANATRVTYAIVLSITLGTAAAILTANLLLSLLVASVALVALRQYNRAQREAGNEMSGVAP